MGGTSASATATSRRRTSARWPGASSCTAGARTGGKFPSRSASAPCTAPRPKPGRAAACWSSPVFATSATGKRRRASCATWRPATARSSRASRPSPSWRRWTRAPAGGNCTSARRSRRFSASRRRNGWRTPSSGTPLLRTWRSTAAAGTASSRTPSSPASRSGRSTASCRATGGWCGSRARRRWCGTPTAGRCSSRASPSTSPALSRRRRS